MADTDKVENTTNDHSAPFDGTVKEPLKTSLASPTHEAQVTVAVPAVPSAKTEGSGLTPLTTSGGSDMPDLGLKESSEPVTPQKSDDTGSAPTPAKEQGRSSDQSVGDEAKPIHESETAPVASPDSATVTPPFAQQAEPTQPTSSASTPSSSEARPAQKMETLPTATESVTPPVPSFITSLLIKARAMIQIRKRNKLDKIMEMLSRAGKVSNNDVRKLLRVSDATATRYFDILEREGKIQRMGKGEATYYAKI